MKNEAYAVIMAGGNGERFWPLSTPERPKQFLSLFGGKPLIRHAVDRLAGLFPPERIFVVTAARLVPQTRQALPTLPHANIVGEPCRRDTAAAVAVAVGLVRRVGGERAVGCVLTADQLIEPASAFRRTLRDAVTAARRSGSIVTLGIEPTFPATGFGYIEYGANVDFGTKTVFAAARRFVEKPDAVTAAKYVMSGRFGWNAGMFIWRADTMAAEFAAHAPDIGALIDGVAQAKSVPTFLRRAYPSVRAISVDYAVMEHTRNILAAKCAFTWDDVGSWLAIPNHFPSDAHGNTCLGRTALLDAAESVVVSDETHLTAVVGLDNVIVVHTPKATLVCAKDRVQDVKRLVAAIGKGR